MPPPPKKKTPQQPPKPTTILINLNNEHTKNARAYVNASCAMDEQLL